MHPSGKSRLPEQRPTGWRTKKTWTSMDGNEMKLGSIIEMSQMITPTNSWNLSETNWRSQKENTWKNYSPKKAVRKLGKLSKKFSTQIREKLQNISLISFLKLIQNTSSQSRSTRSHIRRGDKSHQKFEIELFKTRYDNIPEKFIKPVSENVASPL